MDLFNQGPYKSAFCILHCILKKMGWQSLLHGKMNLDICLYVYFVPLCSTEALHRVAAGSGSLHYLDRS